MSPGPINGKGAIESDSLTNQESLPLQRKAPSCHPQPLTWPGAGPQHSLGARPDVV